MPDSYLLSVYITATVLFVLIVFLLFYLLINFRNRRNQHYIEKQQLLSANLEEGERMMNQIAKEVHDNIGQLSHILHVMLRQIGKTVNEQERSGIIKHACDINEVIIRHVDHISKSLNSDFMKERGLTNTIQDDIEHVRSALKLACHVEFIGEVRKFNPDKELIIYRIVQEAMHNILKHSEATLLTVSFYYSEKKFRIEIKDDGIGFNIIEAENKGIGLSNMKARADVLHGELTIWSAVGSGSCITLAIDEIAT